MSFQFVVLGLTVVLVLLLGVLAVISSTSGGVDWLQNAWQGKEELPAPLTPGAMRNQATIDGQARTTSQARQMRSGMRSSGDTVATAPAFAASRGMP